MSSFYVIEWPHFSGDGQLLADSKMRLWKNGRPLEPLMLERLEPKQIQEAKFCMAMGSPEEPLSAHGNWPARMQALGQALQATGGRGWKAYSAAGVLTLSYGKDRFFSIPVDHGYDHALGAVELALRQSPPSSGTVFLFEANDNKAQPNHLAAIFERLGLRVKPLYLGSGIAGLVSLAVKNAPKGLPSGIALLSFLLVVSIFWQPQRMASVSSSGSGSSITKTQDAPAATSAFERLLNPIAQALGGTSVNEIQRLTLEPGAAINSIAVSLYLLNATLGAPTDPQFIQETLARLPGVSGVNAPRGPEGPFSFQLGAPPGIRFSPQTGGVKKKEDVSVQKGLDTLSSSLKDIARKSAIEIGDLRDNQGNVVFEVPEQPIHSVIYFLGQMSAGNPELRFTRVELQRGSQPGLLSALVGLEAL